MLKFLKKKDGKKTESEIIETSSAKAITDEVIPNIEPDPEIKKNSLISRLRQGLSRTSNQLTDGISGIFTRSKLDSQMVEELEELLIMADMGVEAATHITSEFAKDRYDKNIDAHEVRALLAEQIAEILQPTQVELSLGHSPTVIMMVGVNGNGKTTTIGKLAAHFKSQGKSVMLAASDTFRAAAVEQLQVWAQRANVPIITGAHQADPASVAFSALQEARAQNIDVLLIDTAGRLQNKGNLMQELQKIKRVLGKDGQDAPHHVVMVLDGTTGQNAISQAKTFDEMVGLSGLIITKLDGTARGGVVVALAKQFALPIYFVGVGEQAQDLQIFNAQHFANNLLGVSS